MALTLEQKAQAYLIREQVLLILSYNEDAVITTAVDTYEDDKVLFSHNKVVGDVVEVYVKLVDSSSSSSSGGVAEDPEQVLVFAASSVAITTFRHTARWVTYVDDLATDAQVLADEEAAAQVDQFSTIDDAAIFPELVASLSDSPDLGVLARSGAVLKTAEDLSGEHLISAPTTTATTVRDAAPPESPAQPGTPMVPLDRLKDRK